MQRPGLRALVRDTLLVPKTWHVLHVAPPGNLCYGGTSSPKVIQNKKCRGGGKGFEKLQAPLSTWCVHGMPSKMAPNLSGDIFGPSQTQIRGSYGTPYHIFGDLGTFKWTISPWFKSVQRSALDPGKLPVAQRLPLRRSPPPGEHHPCLKFRLSHDSQEH